MFASSTHHPQLLPSRNYFATDVFADEFRNVFSDAWHCVASRSDFKREGDYRTLTIGDYPVLLRRESEQVHAYLNVCSHRFSMLRHDDHGNMPKLQCQYHGWEYSACGNTQKIPDAKSFKPLKKGMLGLTTFSVETCGDLVFVNLSPDAKPLSQHLVSHAEQLSDWFGAAWYPMMAYDVQTQANWKAYLENGIESYHVDSVHSKTLVKSPPAEKCVHRLEKDWTSFTTTQPDPRWLFRKVDAISRKILAADSQPYIHVHLYPHLTFIRMSVYSYMESVIPISATESRIVTRGYVHRGTNPGVFRKLYAAVSGKLGSDLLRKIQLEDCSILQACQEGLSSEQKPSGGLISTREERIFHFQRYVLQRLGQEASPSC